MLANSLIMQFLLHENYSVLKIRRRQLLFLIPLQDNKFNRMKSELKMIEAGYFKKAVIVSEVHPYTNVINRKNCLSVGVRQDWTPKIRGLLKNHKWQDDIRFELNELILIF